MLPESKQKDMQDANLIRKINSEDECLLATDNEEIIIPQSCIHDKDSITGGTKLKSTTSHTTLLNDSNNYANIVSPKKFFISICGYDQQLWRELEYVISDM